MSFGGMGRGFGRLNLGLLGGANAPLIVNQALLYTPPYQTVIQGAKTGTQNYILVAGDSVPFGYGSSASTTTYRYNSISNRLATILAAAGIRSSAQGWLGNGNLHATGVATQFDDRQANGAPAWGGGVNSLGGQSMLGNNTAATWAFSPKNADGSAFSSDAHELFYLQFGGAGHLGNQIDAAAVTDINANGANTFKVRAFTGLSLGAHTQTISWVSGGVYFVGANAYNSATVGLKFINAAINGGILTDFTANTNYYDPVNAATALAPAIIIMEIGPNYWNNGVPVATFSSDLDIFISRYSPIGQIILISGPPSNPATRASLATQKTYVDVMINKSRASNFLFLNNWQNFGGLSTSAATFAAQFLLDGIHTNDVGNNTTAQFVAAPIVAAAQ